MRLNLLALFIFSLLTVNAHASANQPWNCSISGMFFYDRAGATRAEATDLVVQECLKMETKVCSQVSCYVEAVVDLNKPQHPDEPPVNVKVYECSTSGGGGYYTANSQDEYDADTKAFRSCLQNKKASERDCYANMTCRQY